MTNGGNYTQTGLSPGVRYFFQVYTVTSKYLEGINANRINIVAKCELEMDISMVISGRGGDWGVLY